MTGSANLPHLCLFNRPEFSDLNIAGSEVYERVDYHAKERFIGSLAGVREGSLFTSGYSAGFGGADFLREEESLENIMNFSQHCIEALRAMGVRTARIRAKPLHYSANEHYLQFALSRGGFAVEDENLTFYLDVRSWTTASQYMESLRSAQKRHLKLALAQNLDWREARGDADWAAGYDVLVQSRERHGAQLSLSAAYIMRLRAVFGQSIRLFLLETEGGPVAACLRYLIRPGHAQVMYWGDQAQRQTPSLNTGPPVAVMNLLAYRVVEQGIADGLQTIDLGPATSSQNINYGNCVFKASINALPDFRRTFVKTL